MSTGRYGTWIAFVVWALVFVMMIFSLAGLPRDRPRGEPGQRPDRGDPVSPDLGS